MMRWAVRGERGRSRPDTATRCANPRIALQAPSAARRASGAQRAGPLASSVESFKSGLASYASLEAEAPPPAAPNGLGSSMHAPMHDKNPQQHLKSPRARIPWCNSSAASQYNIETGVLEVQSSRFVRLLWPDQRAFSCQSQICNARAAKHL